MRTSRGGMVAGLCSALLSSNALAQADDAHLSLAVVPVVLPSPASSSALPSVASPGPSSSSSSSSSPGPERLDVSAAVDSQDGLIGSAYFGKNNFIPGIFTFATLRYAREAQRATVGVLKPNAFGNHVDAGVDVDFRRDAYGDQGFNTTTYGVEPYMQFHTARAGVVTAGVGYRVQTVNGLADDAPLSFREDAGTRSGLYLRLSSTFAKFVETERLTLSANVDNHLYNLTSGSEAIWQSEGRVQSRFAVVPNSVNLLNTVRIGAMGGVGGGSPGVADRFFIGGASLRGFAPRRVGPRDENYFAGGERYATASVDLVKQMGRVLNTPVSVGVFADVGSLWGAPVEAATSNNTHPTVRASAGIAVTLSVAGIPVSAYVAKPLRKGANDVDQIVGVAVSMRF